MARTKSSGLERSQLSDDPEQLASEAGLAALRAALASRDVRRILEAAQLVKRHALRGLSPALADCYRQLAGPKGQLDPGCLAKEALLAALDADDYDDASLFAEAASLTQRERGKNGSRDTAGRVRVRAVLGLSRLGHADLLPIFGARLADAEPSVRHATARAVAHRGQREGAGLLLLKLGLGDADLEVSLECLRGLFALAPDLAVPEARRMLVMDDPSTRELTLQGLGTANDDRALAVLQEELERSLLAHERAAIIEALGLSVRPPARALLLALIADGSEADGKAALRALSIHRYDRKLVDELREVVARSGSADLRELFERELAG